MIKDRDEVIAKLIEIKYERNDINFSRNKFRVRGDVLDIFPSDAYNTAVRVEFFGDEVERITEINTVTVKLLVKESILRYILHHIMLLRLRSVTML